MQVNNATLGRIFYLLGAPVGNKTKIHFAVPYCILSNKALERKFLQALLEDELTTIKIEKSNYSIKHRLKLAKRPDLIDNLRHFMIQVKKVIESFGIKCSHISKPIKGDKTDELYFFIQRNKENIIRFKEQIGFRLNQSKVKELDRCYAILRASLDK